MSTNFGSRNLKSQANPNSDSEKKKTTIKLQANTGTLDDKRIPLSQCVQDQDSGWTEMLVERWPKDPALALGCAPQIIQPFKPQLL